MKKEIYKVTSTDIFTTNRGYKVFRLQLDNSIWASKLSPMRNRDKKYDSLYKIYKENNESLDVLVGKYIHIQYLHESKYGMEFSSINSYDCIEDFKKLLEKSEGKAFSTNIPIYDFLKQRNYQINHDKLITLKFPYNHFDITPDSCCYPNNPKPNTLTRNNIGVIYNKFFKDKKDDPKDKDLEFKYRLTCVSIVQDTKRYHRYKSNRAIRSSYTVLTIGDKLNEEYIEFISKYSRE